MTHGTHVHETLGGVRIIDTEGLSHVGRSRSGEALVRQLLISTYLTSSWLVWLDTEVLSSSFFTTMWLVHDYVADVLRVRDAAGERLPRLMYVRTQETEVQRHEYCKDFADFGSFFERVLESHEDAPILRQMFAPMGGVRGCALPIWTMDDLQSYEADVFWTDAHSSTFKSEVEKLRSTLLDGGSADAEARTGPPLLALGALEQHLPRIAKLEAFDPRDHESAKVIRLRAHLVASYGRIKTCADGRPDPVGLANLFEPGDRDLALHGNRVDQAVRARVEDHCKRMRLDSEVAWADAEVVEFVAQFDRVAEVFSAAVDAFACQDLSEIAILRSSFLRWRLDGALAAEALAARRSEAEAQFLAASGLQATDMKRLNLHQSVKGRIDECIMRIRGLAAGELPLKEARGSAASPARVWHLGEWAGSAPRDGKATRARRREFALWTDGAGWALYEEVKQSEGRVGMLVEKGALDEGEGPLPVPP